MRPSLTVLIASMGRPSLERTLTSLRDQLQGDDEVLLVSDGQIDELRRRGDERSLYFATRLEIARLLWDASGLPGRFIELPGGPHRDWGHSPRNKTMRLVRTTHMLHMDDDDSYVAGALDSVRTAVMRYPDRPLIFRMLLPDGHVIWQEPTIESSLSTQMIVHPSDRYGVWESKYGGDQTFIRETCRLYPDGPIFRPEIVARYRHSFATAQPVGPQRPDGTYELVPSYQSQSCKYVAYSL